jgi:hypothetical protein
MAKKRSRHHIPRGILPSWYAKFREAHCGTRVLLDTKEKLFISLAKYIQYVNPGIIMSEFGYLNKHV